jgi:hypothetical protein
MPFFTIKNSEKCRFLVKFGNLQKASEDTAKLADIPIR